MDTCSGVVMLQEGWARCMVQGSRALWSVVLKLDETRIARSQIHMKRGIVPE